MIKQIITKLLLIFVNNSLGNLYGFLGLVEPALTDKALGFGRGIINNGLDLLNVTSYYQSIVKGIIIVGAVWLDRQQNKS